MPPGRHELDAMTSQVPMKAIPTTMVSDDDGGALSVQPANRRRLRRGDMALIAVFVTAFRTPNGT